MWISTLLAIYRVHSGNGLLPFAFIFIALVIGVAAMVWRFSRGRKMVAEWAAAHGLILLECEYRWLRKGKYFWTSGKNQSVYRITARFPDGSVRTGWVRCGGWFLGLLSSRVDAKWDDMPAMAPGFPVVMPPGYPPAQPMPPYAPRYPAQAYGHPPPIVQAPSTAQAPLPPDAPMFKPPRHL